MSELRLTEPKLVPFLATRCLYWGIHLSSDELDLSEYHSWPPYASMGVHLPQVFVTKLVTHMATRCLCLGRVRLTFCLIGSQPASQLASCNWPANQPCYKISTCQGLGWSDIWWQEDTEPGHIGPLFRIPSLPVVPLGQWPTWPRAGKWHKWPLQPIIYLWHYV